eukprot:TRINITY_DN61920_c0_g1_i1.p1 TRINITY_DN61920_c0_g1~~TRINITY_DN61920_c0_g1_i1.p1  ORF type:complete len:450 (+),score=171.01 TRINITY_DN61920_c0_g1_i1:80-1351(+)
MNWGELAGYAVAGGAATGAVVLCLRCLPREQRRRGGQTYCGDAQLYRRDEERGETVPSPDWFALDSATLQEKGWPRGIVVQISGCRDEETAADAQDKDGIPCGACTQSFLRTMRGGGPPGLTWITLLNHQRWWLEDGVRQENPGAKPFAQHPRLSLSAWDPDPAALKRDLMRPVSFTYNSLAARRAPGQRKRRALLIGINYAPCDGNPYSRFLRPEWALDGCVPDQRALHKFLLEQGWKEDELTLMLDCPDSEKGPALKGAEGWPTKRNIERELNKLVAGLEAGDFVWLSFSGHGMQQEERPGQGRNFTELDGLDECVFCGDGQTIEDDWIYNEVVCKVPEGCQMFSIIDCCHSGTILDLPLAVRVGCKQNRTVRTKKRRPDGQAERDADGRAVMVQRPFGSLSSAEHLRHLAAEIAAGLRPA